MSARLKELFSSNPYKETTSPRARERLVFTARVSEYTKTRPRHGDI